VAPGVVSTPTPTRHATYPTPSHKPPTAIPSPVYPVSLPEDLQIFVLLADAEPAPFQGPSKLVMLAFVNTRFGIVSLLSLPPDLFVYVPGWTMQRLSAVFPRGGFELLALTVEYNFGVRPTHWALIHRDGFSRLVDAFGGVTVSILTAVPESCEGISVGEVKLSGEQAYCYVSSWLDDDEFGRQEREQRILRSLYSLLVTPEHLMRLDELYQKYQDKIQTDLTLEALRGYIPLAVKLVDPQRVFYFRLNALDVSEWEIPGSGGVMVLLPKRERVMAKVRQALDVLRTPLPYSEIIATMEAALTPGYEPAPTITSSPTLTATPTTTPASSPTSYP
jgi:LCP family protein required for cell wall assembly